MLSKGWRLALELHATGSAWTWAAPVLGVAIGVPKVLFIFNRACDRNLDRIAALNDPKVWQFFRPVFFIALAAMIAAGAGMSVLAVSSFGWLVFVVALDFSLATGLLGSLPRFVKHEVSA